MSDTEVNTAPSAPSAPPTAGELEQLRAELRELRESVTRLARPPVSSVGAMAPRGTEPDTGRQLAAAAAQTGDRHAVHAYMRLRRESAD